MKKMTKISKLLVFGFSLFLGIGNAASAASVTYYFGSKSSGKTPLSKDLTLGQVYTCTRSTFGTTDPAPGYPKNCYVDNTLNLSAASENAKFPANGGTTKYYFGAPGKSNSALLVPGQTYSCNSGTFANGDPAPGSAKKCYSDSTLKTIIATENRTFIAK